MTFTGRHLMASANLRPPATIAEAAPADQALYKEDRPRRIDRTISFFGDDDADVCGEELLEVLDEPWSQR